MALSRAGHEETRNTDARVTQEAETHWICTILPAHAGLNTSGIKTLAGTEEGIKICNLCNVGYLTVYYWLTPPDKSFPFAELHPASSVAKWGGCAWQMVLIITAVNSTDRHKSQRFSFIVLALPLPKWLWTSKYNSLCLNCLILQQDKSTIL